MWPLVEVESVLAVRGGAAAEATTGLEQRRGDATRGQMGCGHQARRPAADDDCGAWGNSFEWSHVN
jgi:hypothetical protein